MCAHVCEALLCARCWVRLWSRRIQVLILTSFPAEWSWGSSLLSLSLSLPRCKIRPPPKVGKSVAEIHPSSNNRSQEEATWAPCDPGAFSPEVILNTFSSLPV